MIHPKNDADNLLSPQIPIPSRLIFPEEGQVRIRKVVHRSNHGHVYKFPSAKNGRIMELESIIERDRARLLEVDPLVRRYCEQPFRIEYYLEGKVRNMVPDMLVERIEGSLVVEEIKQEKMANEPEFMHRIDIERKLLAHHGYQLEVHVDTEIRSGFKLKNAIKLLQYRRKTVNSLIKEAVEDVLSGGALTGEELIALVPDLEEQTLLALLVKGHIAADLSAPLDMTTSFKRV